MKKKEKRIYLLLSLFVTFFLFFFVSEVKAEEKELIVGWSNEKEWEMVKQSTQVKKVYKHLSLAVVVADEKELNKLKESNHIVIGANDTIQLPNPTKRRKIDLYNLNKSSDHIPYGVKYVGALEAHKHGVTGKGVKVAVIDSGVAKHFDLNVKQRINFVDDEDEFDYNGHGTHVAGIIAALKNNKGVLGVAPDVELYSIKVLNANGQGYMEDLVSAIEWCIENKMDIINLSLGFKERKNDMYIRIMERAKQSGILFVAASGNDGVFADESNVNYPAKEDFVVAVSSVGEELDVSVFSSFGEEVDVASFGENIISTYNDDAFAVLSGTSMATPHISGLLALLKEKYPTYSNESIKKKLFDTTFKIPNSNSIYYGFGIGKYENSKQLNVVYEKIKYEERLNKAKELLSEAKEKVTLFTIREAERAINELREPEKTKLKKELNKVKEAFQFKKKKEVYHYLSLYQKTKDNKYKRMIYDQLPYLAAKDQKIIKKKLARMKTN